LTELGPIATAISSWILSTVTWGNERGALGEGLASRGAHRLIERFAAAS